MKMFSRILVGILLSLIPLGQHCARANDSIFPAQAVAQGAITFDGKGFLINGQRIFIVSAGMEYARVPQALWADRLMRFKRAGFNCVEVYTFWNYHEAQSGQFDFSGNRDLDGFLKLAKSLGLYAIVRVGPYYCAEWDSGGYPIWLRSVPNLQVRNGNAAFEQYVARFFGQLLPIVVNNQLSRGGNVILVQLENEHPSGWGTDGLGDSYFQFLQSTALKAGLEVPYFFSGLNHGSDPAGNSPWSSASRSGPWFTTEFWCDWYTAYGETASDVSSKDWSTWKIIAYGGNGYNYYMAHGGTDFDYFNNDEDAASYDYGAAVGQTGDLRPEYYKYKRAAWFARSFQSILETSDNATSAYTNAAANHAVAVTARTGTAGTILFLANSGTSAQQTQVAINGVMYPQAGLLTVNASEIMPVVTGYSLPGGVTLNVAPTRILGITQQANTTSLVIYGQAGSPAELYFGVPAGVTISAGASGLSLSGTNLTLKTTYPSAGVSNYSFQNGSQRVRILVVSDAVADATWFVEAGGQNYIVCGPQSVGSAIVTNGYLQLATEVPWQNAVNRPTIAYGPSDTPVSLSAITTPGAHPGAVTLTAWQTKTGIAPASTGFDTTGWLSSSSGPQQMGADGDASNCAWYRTTINASAPGTCCIVLGSVADHMIPFVDGTAVPAANISGSAFTTTLSAGTHTIAVFTAHYGRNKLYGYVGPISGMYVKGLSGAAYFLSTPISGPAALTSWKTMPTNSAAAGQAPPVSTALGWTNYTVGTDAFKGSNGYAWFQTTLPAVASGAEIVSFSSVDDNGWVYLNGTLVATNTGWNSPFSANLSSAWKTNGTNVLSVLVQNTGGAGGLYGSVSFSAYQNQITLTNWVQHGGPGDPNAVTGWQTLGIGQTFNGPQFFRSTFTAAPFGATGPDPMWRVTSSGLSRGSVWVNGHNLGRYPETVAAPGLYIPECWLNAGANANTLVIYDEGGSLPTQVRVQPETGASRDWITFQTAQTINTSAPPAPSGLSTVVSSGRVSLSWNAVPGALCYNIKRSIASGGEATVGTSLTPAYTDTGLPNGSYYYVVSAVDSNNEGANSSEIVATILPRPNLALGRSASADSQQSGNYASNGNDGNIGTRWCANDGNLNHWWQVDLGAIYSLGGDEVLWERSGAYGYTVSVSTNNVNWTTVLNTTATAQDQMDSFSAFGRYVRITITRLPAGTWASFYEFRVFGLQAPSATSPFTLPETNVVIVGGTASLRVSQAGTLPITNQWTFSGSNLFDTDRIAGSQSNVLTVANAQFADAGYYQLNMANAAGPYKIYPGGGANQRLIVVAGPTFLTDGLSWASNGDSTFAGNVLTLTSGASQSRSAFFNSPAFIGAFEASFTYKYAGGGGDGIAFCLQTDPRGTAAMGSGPLGVSEISPSVELGFNISNTPSVSFGVNGGTGSPQYKTAPIDMASGDPIAVRLVYFNGVLGVTLTNLATSDRFNTNMTVGDLPTILGSQTACVGFTGGSSAAGSTQTISDFAYVPLTSLSTSISGSTLFLTWPAVPAGYTIQSTPTLAVPAWQDVNGTSNPVSGQNEVILAIGTNAQFFRLVIKNAVP